MATLFRNDDDPYKMLYLTGRIYMTENSDGIHIHFKDYILTIRRPELLRAIRNVRYPDSRYKSGYRPTPPPPPSTDDIHSV